MGEAFYERLDETTFRSTDHTTGPWGPDTQHLGPPSALLARAMERCAERPDTQVARVTVEILGPVPVDELTVTARLERPGRSVELLAGELSAGGRVVATARAWRILTSDSEAVVAGGAPPLAAPETGTPQGRPEGWGAGYLDAMEWRGLSGGLGERGPAVVWARQRVDLVAGEEPTAIQRLLTVADSGNGISNRLHPQRWWFINTELTVHVQRPPEGEWIGVDANTVIGPNGVGTAHTVLHDHSGPVATGAQALMIRPR